MCYKRPVAKLKCGKGMVLSKDGKKCNRKVVVTIKSKCPKGFVLKGKTCLKFITIVKNTCPKGYVKKGKMCEKTGKAVYNCPKGYVKKGMTCTKTVTLNVTSKVKKPTGKKPAKGKKSQEGRQKR